MKMDKIKFYVDKLLKEYEGGEKFFDKLDEVIRLPKNIDIIKSLFNIIYKEQGNKFNVVVSGKFGDWVHFLIKNGSLKIKGNLILVKGSLRLQGTRLDKISFDKNIDVIYQKHSIEEQDYIFIDDSYYSGSTKKAIEEWLKGYNSKIIQTYVIYDGHDKKYDELKSLYRYYDYHTGKMIPVIKLFEILDRIKDTIPFDYNIIADKISKGEIRTTRELYNFIKKVSDKIGVKFNFNRLYTMKQYEAIEYGDDDKYEVPIIVNNVEEFEKILSVIDDYGVDRGEDINWCYRYIRNGTPIVIFINLKEWEIIKPCTLGCISNPGWYKEHGFISVWPTLLTIDNIEHIKKILMKREIIPIQKKPTYKPKGKIKRIGESANFTNNMVYIYCDSIKKAEELEHKLHSHGYVWSGNSKYILRDWNEMYGRISGSMTIFLNLKEKTFDGYSGKKKYDYEYPNGIIDTILKYGRKKPTYKPKGQIKRIDESVKIHNKYAFIAKSREEEIYIQKKLFEKGYTWQGEKIMRHNFEGGVVAIFVGYRSKFLTYTQADNHLELKEKIQNMSAFIDADYIIFDNYKDIDNVDMILKRGHSKPSYKPKGKIKRIE